jgi:two-component system, NtrC family, response regulator AtoC
MTKANLSISETAPSPAVSLLIVDDSEELCRTLRNYLVRRGCEVRICSDVSAARGELDREPVDVLLTDFFIGSETCESLVRWTIQERRAHIVYAMSGSLDEETTARAKRVGCSDLFDKPIDRVRLDEILRARLDQMSIDLPAWRATYAADLIGDDPVLLDQLEILRNVADTDATVLIMGETGTGKELAARAVHRASPRRDGPFVAVNCASMPESLIEDELFGHAPGAFTGAASVRDGRILSANGGTLFLDEIGDMPLAAQAKLLRVLQDRVVTPLGSDRSIPFDARIVAATNRDLDAMVDEGTFREDLLYRLAVVTMCLPPLRQRPKDIMPLASHFRALANAIERAVLLKRTGALTIRELDLMRPPRAGSSPKGGAPPRPVSSVSLNLREAVERVEREMIELALERANGNRTEAAALLGLNRTTLVEKLKKSSVA